MEPRTGAPSGQDTEDSEEARPSCARLSLGVVAAQVVGYTAALAYALTGIHPLAILAYGLLLVGALVKAAQSATETTDLDKLP